MIKMELAIVVRMNTANENLEIEVKFFITHIPGLHDRLLAMGATAGSEVFESNTRFEDSGQTLKKGGRLLRLRKDGACRMTYKCPPLKDDPAYKVYKELEVDVSDCDVMTAILQSLGFHPAQVYEKWRRVYEWRDVELCLDRMPFGDFLEIEGPKQSIRGAAGRLDLAWKDRILTNYLAIFELVRKEYGLPFNDVTFANFERYPVNLVPMLPILCAGD
jgi:adenylate cyclase class 2